MTTNAGNLRERDAANYLGLSPRTLQQWRYLGRGPRFVRVSDRCIRYRMRDLDDWLASRLVETASTSA